MDFNNKLEKLQELQNKLIEDLSRMINLELDTDILIKLNDERVEKDYLIIKGDSKQVLVEIRKGLVYDFTGGYGTDTINRQSRKAIVGLLDAIQVITTRIGYEIGQYNINKM